jgi:hypothetical protein
MRPASMAYTCAAWRYTLRQQVELIFHRDERGFECDGASV